jgi:rhodanese-related sulfurtransferase
MPADYALSLEEFKQWRAKGFRPLDTRSVDEAAQGMVPSSLLVPPGPKTERILEAFVLPEQGMLLVAPTGEEESHRQWLHERGYRRVIGYLEGGWASWHAAGEPGDLFISMAPEEVALDLQHGQPKPTLLDIRTEATFAEGHLPGAQNLPFSRLFDEYEDLSTQTPYYVYCSDGQLSATVVSWLKLQNRPLVRHIAGGFEAIRREDISLEKGG